MQSTEVKQSRSSAKQSSILAILITVALLFSTTVLSEDQKEQIVLHHDNAMAECGETFSQVDNGFSSFG